MKSKYPEVLVGAVELGGTHCKCAVGSGPDDQILSRVTFSSDVENPTKLLSAVTDWFKAQDKTQGGLRAIGIASFGPVGLRPTSPDYGFITTNTPKENWKGTDVLTPFKQAFPRLPIGFNTDVNGAGLGEHCWGHAQQIDDFVYITMGTGIGGGGMSGGQLIAGMQHPEMGHLLLPAIGQDSFAGACQTHGRCWEGLCSGPAMERRTGIPAHQISDPNVWRQAAEYTGIALANIILVLSPRKIIIGGSVRKAGALGEATFLQLVRAEVVRKLNGYIGCVELSPSGIEDYIMAPKLGDDAGLCGAIALGQAAIRNG